MNRRKAEVWLSRALDGELSPRQQARLDAYLARHPELKTEQEAWRAIGEQYRAHPRPMPSQTPAAAWQDVRRALRQQTDAVERPMSAAALWRFKWAGAFAAVCLLVAGVWTVWRGPDAVPYPGAIAVADRTEVEWVETDLPDAVSMVYEDADTGLTVIWVMMDEPGEEDEHAI